MCLFVVQNALVSIVAHCLEAGYGIVKIIFPNILIHMLFLLENLMLSSNLRALQVLHSYLEINLYLTGFLFIWYFLVLVHWTGTQEIGIPFLALPHNPF